MAHALLGALAAQGPMHPLELRRHGLLFGKGTSVAMAYTRLQERGFVQCKVCITKAGENALRRAEKVGAIRCPTATSSG